MVRWRFLTLVCVVVLATACGGDDDTNGNGAPPAQETEASEEDGAGAGRIRVGIIDNSFAPGSFPLPSGTSVKITVTNNGENPHTFTIDELDVDTGTLQAGEEATVSFEMPDETVEFYCKIHGKNVMSGSISPAG